MKEIHPNWYLDEDKKLFFECHSDCRTCNGSTNENCLSCNYGKFLYKGKCLIECPEKTAKINENNGSEICVDCYDSCKTCFDRGNSTDMKCLSCSEDKFIHKYYYQENEQYLINCFTFNKNETKNYNNTYNNTVIKTISSSELKNQIIDNILNFVNSSELINGTDFIAIVLTSDNMDPIEQLKKGISAVDLGDCTEAIKDYYNISKEESLIILNMESKKNESKENEEKKDDDNSFDLGKNVQIEVFDMSGRNLDLSVCKKDIKVMKYIGDVKELDIESAKGLADQGIDVFNAKDGFFNDLCQNYENNEGKDIILEDRRKDIYQNATFCQKGCKYNGMNYELMTANCLCNSSLLQISSDNNIEDKNEKEEKLNFNTLTESILANLFDFNIEVFNCYNLVFNLKLLSTNIGFYCMGGMFILQLIFLFIYLTKRVKPIKYYMITFNNKKIKDKNNPPPKANKYTTYNKKKLIPKNTERMNIMEYNESNNGNSTSKRKLGFMDVDNVETTVNNKDKFKLNPLFSPIYMNEDNNNANFFKKKGIIRVKKNITQTINNQTNNKKISGKKKEKEKIIFETTDDNNNKIQSNSKKLYSRGKIKQNYLFNKEEKNKDEFNGEIVEEKNNDKINEIIKLSLLSYNDEDLQDMDYELAIVYVKRSFLRIYWTFLVDTQIILGTFCTENYLNLLVIKLSFFIFTFQISFFLNAFFYTDEYVSDAYHNDGVLDFISGLPKSIYSFIATLITTNLLKMLSNSKSELMQVIRENRKNNNYINLIDIKLKKLKRKLIIYFVFVFLLGLLFLYYVSAFCAVYRNSKKYWFIGCLESFGIDSLAAIAICILLAFFRYIAIKKHKKYFYVLANIISVFL